MSVSCCCCSCCCAFLKVHPSITVHGAPGMVVRHDGIHPMICYAPFNYVVPCAFASAALYLLLHRACIGVMIHHTPPAACRCTTTRPFRLFVLFVISLVQQPASRWIDHGSGDIRICMRSTRAICSLFWRAQNDERERETETERDRDCTTVVRGEDPGGEKHQIFWFSIYSLCFAPSEALLSWRKWQMTRASAAGYCGSLEYYSSSSTVLGSGTVLLPTHCVILVYRIIIFQSRCSPFSSFRKRELRTLIFCYIVYLLLISWVSS